MAIRLTADDLRSIVVGATILGSGGGGPRPLGESFAADIADRMDRHGVCVHLAAPDEVDPQARCAIPAGVGSPTATAAGFPLGAVTMAFDRLAELTGGPFDAVLPGEVGAGNSLIPISVALDLSIRSGLDIPVIDAAGAARAMPSLQMSTLAAAGLPVSPVVLANTSTSVEFTAEPAAVADAVMRGVIGGGVFTEDAGAALWPMRAGEAGEACIAGTLSLALRVGRAVRDAATSGADPVAAAVAELHLGRPQQARSEIAVIAVPTPPMGRCPAVVAAYVELFRKMGYGGGYSPFAGG